MRVRAGLTGCGGDAYGISRYVVLDVGHHDERRRHDAEHDRALDAAETVLATLIDPEARLALAYVRRAKAADELEDAAVERVAERRPEIHRLSRSIASRVELVMTGRTRA